MIRRLTAVSLAVFVLSGKPAFAASGDMSFFGGISEGTRLPKTTEIILNKTGTAQATNSQPLVYKEIVFVNGEPKEFEGILTIKTAPIPADKVAGTYVETHTVAQSNTSPEDVDIQRNITFNVNYRKEGRQLIRDYEVTRWTETITVGETALTLDQRQSHFGISTIEDQAPGVLYYKGDTSQRGVYTTQEGDLVTVETFGSFYGYNCAWSNSEVHRIDGTVTNLDGETKFQVRPSVSVNKTLQYSKNEPTAISFAGNYREVIQNKSGLQYDIFIKPKRLVNVEPQGKITIPTYNTFEQLIAPNVEFLKSHPAQSDIEKLFSMQILEGDPKLYKPEQTMTRGQFVAAVAKAIKLPIEQRTARAPTKIIFPDVTINRAEYPYIMAAYNAGITGGKGDGNFAIDSPIDRQEAISILLRTLGLENLALDPTPVTAFADNSEIANWAKQEIAAAEAIGLISSDADGNILPKKLVSKAEAAALINRFINYMRSDLALDYTEHIVNYSN